MRRRDFVALLGSVAIWPLTARAQPSKMPVIGYLGAESPDRFASRLRAFRDGLATAGFTEGGNVAIEYRWAEGNNERLPALATELVRHPVSVCSQRREAWRQR
jgi:putative ABC transport system substrate-binding protein